MCVYIVHTYVCMHTYFCKIICFHKFNTLTYIERKNPELYLHLNSHYLFIIAHITNRKRNRNLPFAFWRPDIYSQGSGRASSTGGSWVPSSLFPSRGSYQSLAVFCLANILLQSTCPSVLHVYLCVLTLSPSSQEHQATDQNDLSMRSLFSCY